MAERNLAFLESRSKGATNLYRKKIDTEAEFRRCLNALPWFPEIMLLANFPRGRLGIVSLCREFGINVVHGEDGFFPHYETMHADPLGFCWESSLPRMIFRCCSDAARKRAGLARQHALAIPAVALPPEVHKPFVLWPLQLIEDQVNVWDLSVDSWVELISNFRMRLPKNYQLVIKEHPRGAARDVKGLAELVIELPNTMLSYQGAPLGSLLRECNAVAGANSTVLYEARLIHNKPVYAYARSWFTNHEELFAPLKLGRTDPLPRFDRVEDPESMRDEVLQDYVDWFLGQLLARQISRETAANPAAFQKRIDHLSYRSYVEHGEAIFE